MIQLSELPRSSCSKYPFMFKLFAKFLVLKVSEVRLQAGNRANTLPSLLQIFLNNEPVAKARRGAGERRAMLLYLQLLGADAVSPAPGSYRYYQCYPIMQEILLASLHHNCLSSRPFGKAICWESILLILWLHILQIIYHKFSSTLI